MKAGEIAAVLEEFAPLRTQESWDNAGFCVGSPEAEVHGVLVGFDCTPALLREAVSRGADMVVTHHPLIFGGLGLSSLMRLDLAMMIFAVYLCLTLNVSINAHLKSEFKLTYAKLGPTEFRLIAMIVTMLFIFIKPLRDFTTSFHMLGRDVQFHALDLFGIVVLAVLLIIYAVTVFNDAAGYSKADPMPKRKD